MGHRIFRETGTSVEGKVLPLDEFRLYIDMKDPTPDPERMEAIVRKAEGMLEEEIPFLPLSLYREFFTIGNRANFERRYFRRRDMAIYLALAEWYEPAEPSRTSSL